MVINIEGITYGTGSYTPVPSSFNISSATVNLYNIQGPISKLYASFSDMDVTWTTGVLTAVNNYTKLTVNLVTNANTLSYPIALDNPFDSYLTNSVFVSVIPTVAGSSFFYIMGY